MTSPQRTAHMAGAMYLVLFACGSFSIFVRSGMDTAYLQAQVGMFLTLFSRGWTISGIFTGLWLFPLGLLVIKSGYVPRVFGIGLIIGCFGYLIPVVTVFLVPQLAKFNLAIMSISGIIEVSFGLWLLFKGANTPADLQSGAQ